MRHLAFFALAFASCTAHPRFEAARVTTALELVPAAADVWTYHAELHGRVIGTTQLLRCEVERTVDGGPPETVQIVTLQEGLFTSVIAVPPETRVSVKASCGDGHGLRVTSNVAQLVSKMDAAPTAHVGVKLSDRLELDASESLANAGTRAAIQHVAWTARGEGEADVAVGEGTTLALPLPRLTTRYTAHVRDARGRDARASVAVSVDADGVHATSEHGAPWIDRAVVYGVVPKLYGEAPLDKLGEALEGLHELGVDALWLAPIFDSPPGDYGYAVTDYFHVRSELGGRAALDRLVERAHARGMRVLLDLVLNHSSAEHRYFREAASIGQRSHYYDFYDRDAGGTPTHYFDWAHLPNFNYGSDEMRNWSLSFSRYWIAGGIDGYRVDAAWGVKVRNPDFYPIWSRALHELDPDALLLAEASALDSYFVQNGFDAAYDWTDELGRHAWEKVFDDEHDIATRLAEQVERTQRSPRPERTFRFLNNNDTGPRFITKHGEAMTRVATAALLTLPGIPCLYSFDEIGGEFEPYAEELPTFGEHAGLRDLHRRLIALRKQSPALHGAGYTLLHGADDVLVYLRSGKHGGERAVVALNFGKERARVALPAEVARLALHEVLAGKAKLARTIDVPPWSAQVFVP